MALVPDQKAFMTRNRNRKEQNWYLFNRPFTVFLLRSLLRLCPFLLSIFMLLLYYIIQQQKTSLSLSACNLPSVYQIENQFLLILGICVFDMKEDPNGFYIAIVWVVLARHFM